MIERLASAVTYSIISIVVAAIAWVMLTGMVP